MVGWSVKFICTKINRSDIKTDALCCVVCIYGEGNGIGMQNCVEWDVFIKLDDYGVQWHCYCYVCWVIRAGSICSTMESCIFYSSE